MAGHLKTATVCELKGRISYSEFTQWQAFDAIHGLDDVRIELQIARFAAYYASTKNDKKRIVDFCPFRKRRAQSSDEMLATLDSTGGRT